MVRLALVIALFLPAFAALAESIPLGKDLLGQECRGEIRAAISPDTRVPPPMDVYCGPSDLAGGRVRADWSDGQSIEQALAASPVAADTGIRLACRPARSDRNGADLVASCTAREGGWPALTVAALRGPLLLQAEGTRTNQPALEAAIAHMAPQGTGAPPSAAARSGSTDGLYDSSLAAKYRDLTELARLNNGMGNHAGAEQAYRSALDLQSKVFGDSDPGLGDTLMHLALEVSNQGRFVEAGELLRRAEPLVRKSIVPLDAPRLVSYQALDAANRHSYAEARALAHQASQARQALVTFQGDGAAGMDGYLAKGELAQSLLIEASMSLRLDDVPAAAIAAAEALAITGDGGNLPGGWRVQALSTMGMVLGRQGRVNESETLLSEAVTLSQRLFGDGMPSVLAWAALGRVRAEQGRYPQAMQAFRQEFSLLSRHSPEGLRLGFEAVSPFILTALDMAEQGGAEREGILDQVFSVLQMVQAGQQADTVSHAALKFASGDERIAKLVAERQESQRRRDEIRLSLATEAARPDDQRDGERETWLAEEYRLAATRMTDLDAQLRTAFPDYANLANPPPVTIARLRAHLRPGEGLVAFAFGDRFGLAVLVTPDRIQARRLEIGKAELAADITELRRGIVVQDGRVGRFDLMLAHSLYRRLFVPLGPDLETVRHLMVIPAGALASLPSAALVVTPPESMEPGRADWLVRHSALTQWPSVGALLAMRRHAGISAASLPLLGIGNPSFQGAGARPAATGLAEHCRSDGPLPAGLLGQLAPLPDTAVELRSVAKVLNASADDILLGPAATEAGFRAKSLERYRVLYFATHGLLPAELRCQSEPGLALTPPSGQARGKGEDGLLEASEIAALHLDADLVVLSACNTASAGSGFGGEALSSLADVFFHAGARSVLASHWPVPSESTTRLMTQVFERGGPAAGEGLDLALQQAQLGMLAQGGTAHPVHWAGFTLIGGTNAGAGP